MFCVLAQLVVKQPYVYLSFLFLQARAVSPYKRRKTSGKQVGNKMLWGSS